MALKSWLCMCFVLFFLTILASGCAPSDAQEYIELPLDSGSLSIPVEKVEPLHKFLESYTPSERQVEISRIQGTAFRSLTGIVYGDIRFNCGSKLCDHVLVQMKDEAFKSLSLHEGSLWISHSFSPDERLLAILLGRNEGTELVRNRIMILHTETLEPAVVWGDPVVTEQALSSDFVFPILDVKWVHETSLEITVPDTPDNSYETLLEWNRTGKTTKTIRLSVTPK
ncbi:hypothetical protein [Brevibacillus invocatus]|uniref:hypothetical protein n=1 Tax=Brevibacillus invocatus TaxID=173959 RepID=UPI0011CDA004